MTGIKAFYKQHRRKIRRLTGGIAILFGGIWLSLFVLAPSPSLGYPKQNNIATITAINAKTGDILPADDIQYEVLLSLYPGVEDVGVLIETNGPDIADINYQVSWPGHLEPYPSSLTYPGDLKVEIGEFNEYTRAAELTTLNQVHYPSRDHFGFVWVNARERVSFSERRIRLRILPQSGTVVLKVQFFSSYQITREYPTHFDADVRPEDDLIVYTYPGDELILTYNDPTLQKMEQYILLFAGILIGVATNIVTEF